MRTFQTEGTMAFLTIEMRMQILHHAIAGIIADGIFQRATSVVDAMDEVMGEKEGDGSGNSRFIYGVEQDFQIQ